MTREQLFRMADFILNEATGQEIDIIKEAVRRREERSGRKGPMGLSPEKMARETAGQIEQQVSISQSQIRDMVRNFAVDIIQKNAPELSEAQIRELTEAWVPDNTANRGNQSDMGGFGRVNRPAESRSDADRAGSAGGSGAAGSAGRANDADRAGSAGGSGAAGSAGRASHADRAGSAGRASHADRAGTTGRGAGNLPKDVLFTMVKQFIAYSTGSMSVTEQSKLREEMPDWQNLYWEHFPDEVKQLIALFMKGMIDENGLWERLNEC